MPLLKKFKPALYGALLGAALSARAQQAAGTLPPLDSIEPAAAAVFAASRETGMVLVVARNNDVWMTSYGETRPGNGQRPGPDSLLRLCSLSKILATDLLVKLSIDHLADFADPLQKFAPKGAVVPTKTLRGVKSRPITLGDLATHTAGLPREVGWRPDGTPHFNWPDRAYRWTWLPEQKLRFPAGSAAHYSNIGFDLLGDAIETAAGKPYAEVFAERTSGPLGLRDTTLSPTPEQCARLLLGGKDEGPCNDTQASAGSGGMYSTAADMTRWLKYLLDLPGVPVHQPSAAQHVYVLPSQLSSMQGLDHAGWPTGLGLGWVRLGLPDDPAMILQKTGGGAGFTTYIALNPAAHVGIFLAATESKHPMHLNLFHEANKMVTELAGLPVPPDPQPQPAKPVKRPTARKPSRRPLKHN